TVHGPDDPHAGPNRLADGHRVWGYPGLGRAAHACARKPLGLGHTDHGTGWLVPRGLPATRAGVGAGRTRTYGRRDAKPPSASFAGGRTRTSRQAAFEDLPIFSGHSRRIGWGRGDGPAGNSLWCNWSWQC